MVGLTREVLSPVSVVPEKSLSDSSKKNLAAHLRAHAVLRGGPFTLRSGEVSDFYVDARQSFFDGRGAELVGTVVASLLPEEIDAVGGMTMGADPIAVATAVVASQQGRPLRAFSVRKETKDHGVGGRLAGPVSPGDRVVALEDTSTTGGAFMQAIEAMWAEGLDVVRAVCIIDRSLGVVADRMRAAGVVYESVFEAEDLGLV